MADGPDSDGGTKSRIEDPLVAPVVSSQVVVRGVAWAGGSQAGQLLLQFPIAVVLSRLIAPRDFGLVAMVLVISGFLKIFVDAGLGAALVHREELEPNHLSTAFWMNLASGMCLSLIVLALAPSVAALYHEPRLELLTAIIAVDFTIGSFGVVQLALLRRQMKFERIALIQNLSTATGGALAITAAAMGAGVWSLIVNVLASTTAQAILASSLGSWRVRGRPDRRAARELWTFSAPQLGFQVVNYWSRNADNFIVGRYLGAGSLGIYGRAYQLMLMPITRIGAVVSSVLFPALARMQDDGPRLRAAYLRTVGVTALVTFPVVAGLFASAPEFVVALLGPRWTDVVPVFRILCVAGLLQSIGTTTGVIYQARGRTDWLLRWGLGSGVITIGAFVIGVQWGVRGVAASYAIRTVVLHYFNFAIPGRLIGMRYRDVFSVAIRPLVLAILMGAGVWETGRLVSGIPIGARLAIEVVTGVVLYGVGVLVVRPESYRDVRRLATAR